MTEKKFLIDYPELVKEWDYEKNSDLDINVFSRGSDKKVWWKCSAYGHSWQSKITKRTHGNNCGICANKVVLQGFNDVATTVPLILDFWDFERNTELSPYKLTKFSRKEAFFKCSCGHKWKKKVCNFVDNKEKCDSCSGKTISKRNSLIINCPDLVNEWDYEKNVDLDINSFTIGMNRNVWWKCLKGHSWRAKIAGRVKNKHSCPYCSNHKILVGYNDLATTHPEVIKWWDFEKNKNFNLEELTFGSDKKVWWKCEKDHSFQSVIKSRTYKRSGCPICSNRIIIKGINDVVSVFPEILDMIDTSLTNIDDLRKVSKGSKQKAWWRCIKGHNSWEASVKSRLLLKSGCPVCSGIRSQMEEDFSIFISKTIHNFSNKFLIINNSRKIIPPYEIDVYIPDLKIAFEFNGDYWHSDDVIRERSGISADEYHNRKVKLCADKGIDLFFVWESEWLDQRDIIEQRIQRIIEQAAKENNG